MNKYIWIIIVAVVLIATGVGYRQFIASDDRAPVVSGNTKEFTVKALKDGWAFEPEEITVERGDKLVIHFVNEDNYDHGVAIDAYGVSQRMPANGTITVEFVATQAGEFPFYCSVPCGEGEVHGQKRTHFDMIGKIKVRDIIKNQ